MNGPGFNYDGMPMRTMIWLAAICWALSPVFAAEDVRKGTPDAGQEEKEKEGKEQPPEDPVFLPIKDMKVVLKNTRTRRVLHFAPVLELNDKEHETYLEKYKFLIKDCIASTAGLVRLSELDSLKGRDLLKQDILRNLNPLLRRKLNCEVKDIYFTSFYIR